MKLLLPILVIAIVIFGYFGLVKNAPTISKQFTSSPSPQTLKTFKSDNMKIAIEVPAKFNIEDKNTTIELTSSAGIISISKNGTNFSNLKEYLKEFDLRRKLIVEESKEMQIGNLHINTRILRFPDESIRQKSAYFYVDNKVYIFSTKEESLYSDLDQIAQSFRYTP